jgi:hypothetical protein
MDKNALKASLDALFAEPGSPYNGYWVGIRFAVLVGVLYLIFGR